MRYLSGLDWVIASLDRAMKNRGSAGHSSQIVMVLDSIPDEAALRAGLAEFAGNFPVLRGRVARNWLNLAPYWETTAGRASPTLRVHGADGPVGGDQSALGDELEEIANARFENDWEHLAFDLVRGNDGKALFIMRFDHRLFDARGAGLYLEYLGRFLGGNRMPPDPGPRATEAPSGLTGWVKKFAAGKTVNRRMIALSGTPSRRLPELRALAEPTQALRPQRRAQRNVAPGRPRVMARFLPVTFDRATTARILDDAHARAGALMEMPYLLAAVIQSVHGLFAGKNIPGGGYVVPVTVDTRSPGDPVAEVFFNYASFLFFQAKDGDIPDRDALIRTIKGQMYDQVKEELPAKLAEVNYLMRIVPLSALGWLMNRFMGGRTWSFTFGYRGKPSYTSLQFMGAPVSGVFHLPRVPAPPGLGVFFDVFDGRMNAVLSWHDGVMDNGEARALVRDIAARLGS